MEPNVDGATSFADLPLAPETRSWDGGAARSRLAKWASSDGSGSKDKIDWPKYRKGFFWYDASVPDEFGSYKLPFADVIDGAARAVWNGVHAAVQRLGGTDIPDADKASVKSHARRYYRKFQKPFPDELAVDEADELAEQLEDATGLQECEDLCVRLTDAHPDRSELLARAESKIETLKHEGREELQDSFLGPVEIVDSLSDGRLKVRAIVAQVDTVNANKRLYPKSEMVDVLKRANRLAKRGAIIGLDGHPALFDSGKAKDIVVRWDAFMLKDNDVHAEGTTVLTGAGKDVTTVWQSGVALEWSIRGFGRPESVEKENGNWSHDIIHDYVLDGVDVVLRGAAKTKTVSLSVESADDVSDVAESQAPPPADEPEADTMSTTMNNEKPPVVEEPKAVEEPKLDVAALTAQVTESILPAVQEATASATAAAFKAKALQDCKDHLLSTITDEDLKRPLTRALAGATSIEEAHAVFDEMQPMLTRALRPDVDYSGIGVVTEDTKRQAKLGTWILDGKPVDRPKTAREAYRQLVESVEDTGGETPKNRGWVWREVLDNYQRMHPEYFEALTRPYLETATSTSAIGTYIGVVLPVLRQAFPMLLPWEIASVWPMKSKTGTIPTLAYSKSTGGYSLSDSTYFDSTYANQTEGSTKPQITFSLDTRTITAIDRALYFDLTTQVRQDMRAEYDIDVEQELIAQCSNEIARETNFAFVEMLMAGATAGNVTFAQTPPSGSAYTGKEWRDNFIAFYEQAAQYVRDNRYRDPQWIICGSAVFALLKTLKSVKVLERDQLRTFGDGLSLVASLDGTVDVYLAAWLSNRSKAIVSYRPREGQFADAVAAYCPYVPLYISEPDFTASTNTTARSVSARDAMTITQPTGISTITISTGTASAELMYS